MKKIGDVTSTADKNGEWTNGNVAAGIAPTILEAGWLNSVQREILGVIIAAGMQQDKNDDTQLSKAISKIISGGDYATKTEVNSKLAKDQNGADIPNKDTFIKNLGLPELLDKKFDKTGGKITGQTDIEAPGGRTQTLKAKAGTSVYQELYLQDIFAAWWGVTAGNKLSLENRITGNALTIGTDGFKIDGKEIATKDRLLCVGQAYRDVTASRKLLATYTNTDPFPRIVYIETNNIGDYIFSIDIKIDGERMAYRWAKNDESFSFFAIVPPGSSYSVRGGWAEEKPWDVVRAWKENVAK
ncbi:hypothetical protein B9086_006350 [Morganella morganii subsp. morganii]|uniref:hypothetical protein n=1 Tax=Morganella morganii TaxID=582 RepID=UPI000B41F477|nr:hypothetical protein [Morganella morganii]RNW13743.1 hypothetical protein B9086_006350 [Morganella morganii subsp. morganii]